MQLRHRTLRSVVAIAFMVTWTLTLPVFAVDIIDDPVQIDERVSQLIQSSNELCWEMHRFHQQQPDYREAYGSAKELWTQAGQLRDALRAGPIETDVLIQESTRMNELLSQIEKSLSKWGAGDRSLAAVNGGPGVRTVTAPGVEVDIPFVGGIRVGGPQVVVNDEVPPQLERLRLHVNSHGSRRSLERDFAAVRIAMVYLLEDAGVSIPAGAPVKLGQVGAVPVSPKPAIGPTPAPKK